MKNRYILCVLVVVFGLIPLHAQQKTSMSLHDAVGMALEKSNDVKLADTKTSTKKYELQNVKNNRYPDLKISGQYLRLTNADIKQESSSTENESGATTDGQKKEKSPKVNQVAIGQASLSLPIFSGFRLKNNIEASENIYKSEVANAAYTKEETAMKVIQYYSDLYKAQQSVALLKESLKRGNQRVTDFRALEQNGLIARNDLLKSQLQVSKIELSLEEASKNVKLLNFYLITLLKLPEDTMIEVGPENIDKDLFLNTVKTESEVMQDRKDIEAARFLCKAAESGVKIAKGGYYPSLSLTAGYLGLDVHNYITVQNAMNVGVGLSYNLSSIFKNGDEVKAAKSKAQEARTQEAMLTDYIKIQIRNAQEEYNLALKQNKVYSEAIAQASENYRIVRDKYDNGLSDTNDLLDADVERLGAEINQANAKANVALKYYELLNASGQLIQSFNFTQNQ